MTQAEVYNAYGMLRENRKRIFDYEKTYGQRLDGQQATQEDRVASANTAYPGLTQQVGMAGVLTLEASLNPAKLKLLQRLRADTVRHVWQGCLLLPVIIIKVLVG